MRRLAAFMAGASVVVAAMAIGTSSAATIGTMTVRPLIGDGKVPVVFTGTECFDTGVGPVGHLELFRGGTSLFVHDLRPDANGVWTDGVLGTSSLGGSGTFRLEARCESGGYDYTPVTFVSVDPEILFGTPRPEPDAPPAAEPIHTSPAFTG